jgi:hypothetical protein
MSDEQPIPERLGRKEASAFLTALGYPVAPKTLAMIASRGHRTGPAYRKFNGRVVYEKSDLIAWVESQLSAKAATTSAHQDIARQRQHAA